MKISGIYKITNTATGDFYIGSSKNIKRRWKEHKCLSKWKESPNNPMYLDFQKHGIDKFDFEILEEVKPDSLKEAEQQFIEKMHPTYNQMNAKGLDVERRKKYKKEYDKEYKKSNKHKEHQKEYQKEYRNQLCCYNGQTLSLNALYLRFRRAGAEHPIIEAKKYIIKK